MNALLYLGSDLPRVAEYDFPRVGAPLPFHFLKAGTLVCRMGMGTASDLHHRIVNHESSTTSCCQGAI